MTGIEVRLREASGLCEVLAAGFEGFEVMRRLARACEDLEPGLLVTFMAAADAAVDGREAICAAPSLRSAGGVGAIGETEAGIDVGEAMETLVGLGTLLVERLARAGETAAADGDRQACLAAAAAAAAITRLMARDGHDRLPG